MKKISVTGRKSSGKSTFISQFINGGEIQKAIFRTLDKPLELKEIRYTVYSGGAEHLHQRVVIQLRDARDYLIESFGLYKVSNDNWEAITEKGNSLGIVSLHSIDDLVRERVTTTNASSLTLLTPMSDYAKEVFKCNLLKIREVEVERVSEESDIDYLFVINSDDTLGEQLLIIGTENWNVPVIYVFNDKSLYEPSRYSQKKIHKAINQRGVKASTAITSDVCNIIILTNLASVNVKIPKNALVILLNSLPNYYSDSALNSAKTLTSKRVTKQVLKSLTFVDTIHSPSRLAEDLDRLLEGIEKSDLIGIIRSVKEDILNIISEEINEGLPYTKHLTELIFLTSKNNNFNVISHGGWSQLETEHLLIELVNLALLSYKKGLRGLTSDKEDTTLRLLEEKLPNLFALITQYKLEGRGVETENLRVAYFESIETLLLRGYYPDKSSLTSLLNLMYAFKLSIQIKHQG